MSDLCIKPQYLLKTEKISYLVGFNSNYSKGVMYIGR